MTAKEFLIIEEKLRKAGPIGLTSHELSHILQTSKPRALRLLLDIGATLPIKQEVRYCKGGSVLVFRMDIYARVQQLRSSYEGYLK
ncbi:hypothetical protein [Spirochaeta cellobiosiphila]|uniref:hypothetical protein n=1 Tax=Spirochaeta cellobiosiphila TaxID=504483 RepID=UPI00041A0389|nr:hypothetical protein [Spirochaeta cellobiosiphila]